MRALLDHSVPRGLRTVLVGVEARHAFEMGWRELHNGDLLWAAERDGFDAIGPPKAAAARGEFATDEQVRAISAKQM